MLETAKKRTCKFCKEELAHIGFLRSHYRDAHNIVMQSGRKKVVDKVPEGMVMIPKNVHEALVLCHTYFFNQIK